MSSFTYYFINDLFLSVEQKKTHSNISVWRCRGGGGGGDAPLFWASNWKWSGLVTDVEHSRVGRSKHNFLPLSRQGCFDAGPAECRVQSEGNGQWTQHFIVVVVVVLLYCKHTESILQNINAFLFFQNIKIIAITTRWIVWCLMESVSSREEYEREGGRMDWMDEQASLSTITFPRLIPPSSRPPPRVSPLGHHYLCKP